MEPPLPPPEVSPSMLGCPYYVNFSFENGNIFWEKTTPNKNMLLELQQNKSQCLNAHFQVIWETLVNRICFEYVLQYVISNMEISNFIFHIEHILL